MATSGSLSHEGLFQPQLNAGNIQKMDVHPMEHTPMKDVKTEKLGKDGKKSNSDVSKVSPSKVDSNKK